jgi:hypothetical protein
VTHSSSSSSSCCVTCCLCCWTSCVTPSWPNTDTGSCRKRPSTWVSHHLVPATAMQ